MAHDLDPDLEKVKTTYDGVVTARKKAEDDLAKSQEDLSKAQGDLTKAKEDLAKAQGDITKAHGDLTKAKDDLRKLSEELERARRGPRDPMPAECKGVDVTAAPYSAKGDGVANDGPTLQKAIAEKVGRTNVPHTLYLPAGAGPYRVDQQLRWHTEGTTAVGFQRRNGFLGYLVAQGDGQTVVRLKDDCPGFTDPAPDKAKAVILTASAANSANAVGGEGNAAFQNSLYQLTVDTGNNAGAIGIDYMASNKGTLRDVTVVTRGVAGISMKREWPGPCYLKNVTVRGGAVGIDVDRPMYSVTMEDVTCEGQATASIRNNDNVLCIRRLRTDRPVVNTGRGVIWLLDSPGVQVQSANANAVIREGKLKLPVREAPEYIDRDPANRRHVAPTGQDDTARLQEALNAGKPSVWMAHGLYKISGTLTVPPTVRRIFGTDSALDMPDTFQGPLFRVEGPFGDPLIIERLNAMGGKEGSGGLVWFEHKGRRDLVLRDLYLGMGVNYRNVPGSGDLFVEDVHGQGSWEVGHGIGAWLRQFNPETLQEATTLRTKLTNDGATVWVMGLKAEGAGTIIHTKNGGRTELVGGFMFYNKAFPPTLPAFLCENSQVSLSFVEANLTNVEKPDLCIRDVKPTGVTEVKRATLLGKRLVNYENVS